MSLSALGQVFLDNSGNSFGPERLSNKRVLLYFSASWCGPCRKFTPLLSDFYAKSRDSLGLEVIFISLDSDPSSHSQYFSKMPWLSIPFEDQSRLRALESAYDCQVIPKLVVLDEQGHTLSSTGVDALRSDPTGSTLALH
jgi:nucleoredoxin